MCGADGRSEPQLCGVGSLRQPSGSPGGEVSRSVSQQRRAHLPVRLPDNHPVRHEDQDPEGTDAPERTTTHWFNRGLCPEMSLCSDSDGHVASEGEEEPELSGAVCPAAGVLSGDRHGEDSFLLPFLLHWTSQTPS